MTRVYPKAQEDNDVSNQAAKKIMPQNIANESYTKSEIEDIVTMVRLHFYNRELPCGPKAIRNYMADISGINTLPSERTIARILKQQGLTNQRTGNYDEEG